MIRAIFFDLDETLLDDERTALAAQELTGQWAAEQRPGLDTRRLREGYHLASTSFWKTYDQARETRTGEELRRSFWRAGLQQCDVDDEAFVEALSRTFGAMREQTYAFFPDAVPCLDALKGRYTLGLITNGAVEIQAPKVAALGLDRCMDHIFIAEAVGISKPDRGIFDVALEAAGCAPHEAAMVGDLLDRDILGATNTGMVPVWINRLPHEGDEVPATHRVNVASDTPAPEHTIRSLDELPPLLERLNSR